MRSDHAILILEGDSATRALYQRELGRRYCVHACGDEDHAFAVLQDRAISAIAYNDNAYIDTFIDNVFVSATDGGAYALYDDFSSFDTGNWRDLQFARKIVDGKVALGVQSTGNRETNNLRFIDLPDYIQARVAISSASQIPSGGIGQARINGYFFNDTKPPAQQTGWARRQKCAQIWAALRRACASGPPDRSVTPYPRAVNIDPPAAWWRR